MVLQKKLAVTGLIFGTLSIIAGAFGAHALKKIFTEMQLETFEVAVRYLMYNGLFLIAISHFKFSKNQASSILRLCFGGVLLFSGSIFGLLFGSHFGINVKFLGPITPIGGVLMIAAWILTIYHIFRSKKENFS